MWKKYSSFFKETVIEFFIPPLTILESIVQLQWDKIIFKLSYLIAFLKEEVFCYSLFFYAPAFLEDIYCFLEEVNYKKSYYFPFHVRFL